MTMRAVYIRVNKYESFGLIAVLLLFGFFLTSFNFYCNEPDKVFRKIKPSSREMLEKIRANYLDMESLAVTMEYELFKGYVGDSVAETYSSEYKRIGESSFRRIKNTEFISNSEVSLKINHDQKIVVLSKPVVASMFDYDIESMLDLCKNVVSTQEGSDTRISLSLKEMTDVPLARFDLIINKHFFIKKLIFYYSMKLDFSNSYFKQDYAFPRLEVEYKDLRNKWEDKTKLLETENYLNTVPNGIDGTGKHFELNSQLKGYELIDLRNI